MARAFLLFNFGSDEEAAQKARHRIDAWKQAFRLGSKVQFKLERQTPAASGDSEGSQGREPKGKGGAAAKPKNTLDAETPERIRLLIRLDFSAHEKNLFQTWLDRIPAEEPFKSVKPEAIQRDAGNFEQISELFDSLD
ncbi:MAG: hypothetical protein WAN10_19035 [Candidatus Acidiferrales bacterium]